MTITPRKGLSGPWRDEQIPATSFTFFTAPPLDPVGPSGNIRARMFEGNGTTTVHGALEFNHDCKHEAIVWPHFHVFPTDSNASAENFVFRTYYTYAVEQDDVLGTDTIVTETFALPAGAAWRKRDHEFAGGLTIPGFKIGTQIFMRFERLANDGNDTYTGDLALSTFGFHVEINKAGSKERFAE